MAPVISTPESKPSCPQRLRARRERRHRNSSARSPSRIHEQKCDRKETPMNLDRFTQRAQEAIVAAQRLAEELQSPVLDSEHLLAALVEADDGIPAETMRRLGADLPVFRGELAAALNKRARIQGGSRSEERRVGKECRSRWSPY